MMSLLNNLRIVLKLGLIALVMGGVMVGLVGYMATRMSAIDEAYSDVVRRVDTSTTSVARIARRAETYREAAFELLTETTDAGNARLLKTTQDVATEVIEGLKKAMSDVPEQATAIGQRIDMFSQT